MSVCQKQRLSLSIPFDLGKETDGGGEEENREAIHHILPADLTLGQALTLISCYGLDML
jgi:hypothetical protein